MWRHVPVKVLWGYLGGHSLYSNLLRLIGEQRGNVKAVVAMVLALVVLVLGWHFSPKFSGRAKAYTLPCFYAF